MKAKRPGRPEGKLCHPHSQELQRQPQSMLFPLCSAKITHKILLGWNNPLSAAPAIQAQILLLTNRAVSSGAWFLQSGLICWDWCHQSNIHRGSSFTPVKFLQPGELLNQDGAAPGPTTGMNQFGKIEKKQFLGKKLLWSRGAGGDLPSCVCHKQEHHEECSLLGKKRV